jgi:NAD-dependent dihydropyrimidine dehydrogenase PreA subunit
MTGLRYLPDVANLQLDVDKCNGCRMCVEVCPHAVFAVEAGKAKVVDRDACMECGACAQNCEPGAITVDAGVGCATAIIIGSLTGKKQTCGGDTTESSCCG